MNIKLLLLSLLALVSLSQAATVWVLWDNRNPNQAVVNNFVYSFANNGLTATNGRLGNGISDGTSGAGLQVTGVNQSTSSAANTNGDYLAVDIAFTSGFKYTLKNSHMDTDGNAFSLAIRSSQDNFSTDYASASIPPINAWKPTTLNPEFLGGQTYTFRFLAFNANATQIADVEDLGLMFETAVFLPAIPAPEPSSMMLSGLGVLGLLARRRRQA